MPSPRAQSEASLNVDPNEFVEVASGAETAAPVTEISEGVRASVEEAFAEQDAEAKAEAASAETPVVVAPPAQEAAAPEPAAEEPSADAADDAPQVTISTDEEDKKE